MEPQIGDIWRFDFHRSYKVVHVLIEGVEDVVPNDKIIHLRILETGETRTRFVATFLDENPTKVA